MIHGWVRLKQRNKAKTIDMGAGSIGSWLLADEQHSGEVLRRSWQKTVERSRETTD